MKCPIFTHAFLSSKTVFQPSDDCITVRCAWYCQGDKECAIKVMAIELLKHNES
jgi:hypothetical protein